MLDLPFKRIQFTPDLMPADIIGTNIIQTDDTGNRELRVPAGPIFAQIVLADEINRATPKTQSALLEAMQEHSVTVGGTIHRLDEPFFVMATQNPIEQEGTYPLPEAQLDRFFFKLVVDYSTRDEIATILDRTTGGESARSRNRCWPATTFADSSKVVREILVAPPVRDYAVRLVLATHPGGEFAAPVTNQYIRVGASPAAPSRSSWPPRCGRSSTASTTSASTTFAGRRSPRCGTAFCRTSKRRPKALRPTPSSSRSLKRLPSDWKRRRCEGSGQRAAHEGRGKKVLFLVEELPRPE